MRMVTTVHPAAPLNAYNIAICETVIWLAHMECWRQCLFEVEEDETTFLKWRSGALTLYGIHNIQKFLLRIRFHTQKLHQFILSAAHQDFPQVFRQSILNVPYAGSLSPDESLLHSLVGLVRSSCCQQLLQLSLGENSSQSLEGRPIQWTRFLLSCHVVICLLLFGLRWSGGLQSQSQVETVVPVKKCTENQINYRVTILTSLHDSGISKRGKSWKGEYCLSSGERWTWGLERKFWSVIYCPFQSSKSSSPWMYFECVQQMN